MDDKKNKKRFTIPEAELVDFANDDIITTSVLSFGNTLGGFGDDDGGDEDF